MKKILKQWAGTIVAVVLLGGWLYTGQQGFYNLYAALAVIGFLMVALVVVGLIAVDVSDKQVLDDETIEKTRAKLPGKSTMFVSRTISIVLFSILMWHEKWFIGSLVFLTFMSGFYMQDFIKRRIA